MSERLTKLWSEYHKEYHKSKYRIENLDDLHKAKDKLGQLEDLEEELGITIEDIVSALKDLFRNHIELCIESDRCYFKIKNSKGKDKSFTSYSFVEWWEEIIKAVTKRS